MQRKNSGRTAPRAALTENRGPSATKSGPGRYHRGGKAGAKLAKARKTRAADALTAAWAPKRVTNAVLRDKYGAYTLTGRMAWRKPGVEPAPCEGVVYSGVGIIGGGVMVRRKWLGGISAQRGF